MSNRARFSAQAETLKTFVEFARDNGFRIFGPQAVGSAHDLDERAEGRLLAIGRAAPHKDPRALLDDLPDEFVHEPRFADAGLADDVEDLDARADGVESALQLLQLRVAPDKLCEAAVEFGAEARRSLADRVEPIGFLRLRFAFDVMLAEEAGLDQPIHETMGRLTHDSGTGFGQGLKARRDVDGVAHDSHSAVRAALHLADDGRSGVEADPKLRPCPVPGFEIVAADS